MPRITITPELFEAILAQVAEGRSVSSVLEPEGMPHRSTFHDYVANTEGAADKYARACEERETRMFEQIEQIADDARNDFMEVARKDGSKDVVFDREHVERSKLRIEARKWMLGKMRPKKYGDKLDVEHGGSLVVHISPDIAKIG